jgi:hypothetical protein
MENKYRKYKQKYISSQMNKFGGGEEVCSEEKSLKDALKKISDECEQNIRNIEMYDGLITTLNILLSVNTNAAVLEDTHKIIKQYEASKKQIIDKFTKEYKKFYEAQLEEYKTSRDESTGQKESLALETKREGLQILNKTFKRMSIEVKDI